MRFFTTVQIWKGVENFTTQIAPPVTVPNLEGQPDWQSAKEDGTYPAPPHDETGHTWHHGDAMLLDYIRRGGQAVLDDMGVDFTSGMPGFGDELTAEDIEAVLDYIKSTWPDRIRAAQSDRSRLEAGAP